MDPTALLHPLSLPDWLPWWALVAVLAPVALYLAMFLLMPFQTFGLRGRIRELELRIDALHEELRSMTLRLPERGLDPYDDPPPRAAPPIPPAPRAGFGDPVADKMLDYMRDKARADMQRADAPRPRTEPRVFGPRPGEPPPRQPDLPPPPPVGGAISPDDAPDPPPPPRPGARFGRRFTPPPPHPDDPPPRPDWQR
jgi:hypothetical protein